MLNPNRLKYARKRAGLQQNELAVKLGVSSSLPGKWERGEKVPSLEKLGALAKLLQVSVDWLTTHQIEDGGSSDDSNLLSREAILSDYTAPSGLRNLASNEALVKALCIRAEEWGALRSLSPPNQLTSDGYVAVLIALRAHVT
jgi:transcriptional regulator with XRE-family HTH domain